MRNKLIPIRFAYGLIAFW